MMRPEVIAEITRRLVEYYQRVYLFGSAARGEGPAGDLDFCVVLPDAARRVESGIYERLRDFGTATDVVGIASSDFDVRSAFVRSSLPATVQREGRLLYDARTVGAAMKHGDGWLRRGKT